MAAVHVLGRIQDSFSLGSAPEESTPRALEVLVVLVKVSVHHWSGIGQG